MGPFAEAGIKVKATRMWNARRAAAITASNTFSLRIDGRAGDLATDPSMTDMFGALQSQEVEGLPVILGIIAGNQMLVLIENAARLNATGVMQGIQNRCKD
jgi:hypothetical protein